MANPAIALNIVTNALQRRSASESLIVPNHLMQMAMFAVKGGVEFYPEVDNETGDRANLLDRIWSSNKLDLYLYRLVEILCCSGAVGFYLIVGDSAQCPYKIRFYDKSQFSVSYNAYGDIESVIIKYSYKVSATPQPMAGQPFAGAIATQVRWCRIRLTVDHIDNQIGMMSDPGWVYGDSIPIVDQADIDEGSVPTPPPEAVRRSPNPFQQIPFWLAENYPLGPGQDSSDDFSPLAEQIAIHDELVRKVNKNLKKFSNQTILTTLQSDQVFEQVGSGGDIAMKQTQAGSGMSSMATLGSFWTTDQFAAMASRDPETKVRDIIGGMMPEDQFSPVTYQPVGADQVAAIAAYEDDIRYALGGINERSGRAGSVLELKSQMGRVEVTAKRKATALFTYGLTPAFELAISNEEMVFAASEGAQGIPPQFDDKGNLADTSVSWRHTGEVFPDTPDDLLKKSIVGRNLQELGVGTHQVLRFVYPDKTDRELGTLTGGSGGVPFRYMNELTGIIAQLGQTIDPQTGLPLSAIVDLVPYLEKAIAYGRNPAGNDSNLNSADSGSAAASPDGRNSTGTAKPGRPMGADQYAGQSVAPSAGSTVTESIGSTWSGLTDWNRSPIYRGINGIRKGLGF